MEKIITDDGSITFRNDKLDECYHTKSGALDESLRKHVIPSKILDEVKDEIHIADICFGLGYNSIVAISEIWKINPNCKIYLYAFENDINIMNELKNISLNSELEKIKNLMLVLIEKGEFIEKNFYGKLFLGDFREELKNCDNSLFDAVFFDPFSPGKVPELWSEEVFSLVYAKCKLNCVLTTYSCARMVRDNMKKAGFKVENGPCIGRRSPSTVCIR